MKSVAASQSSSVLVLVGSDGQMALAVRLLPALVWNVATWKAHSSGQSSREHPGFAPSPCLRLAWRTALLCCWGLDLTAGHTHAGGWNSSVTFLVEGERLGGMGK